MAVTTQNAPKTSQLHALFNDASNNCFALHSALIPRNDCFQPQSIMAIGKKAYPRATVKKIIKAHSNMAIKKSADVTIFLNYVLFMETLVKEAAIYAKQSGERGLTARSVNKVTRDTLAKFKG
ncbi:hypothetical protein EsDP_00004257 [Epichloe bromicola]|uniref:Transcription factor CBF/NF-Y/archaeal histone domain-containing protein n=1 Tax=Epichloe bromicola TaxID=79588 RepID=A0ABQ0CRK9_9HYPO